MKLQEKKSPTWIAHPYAGCKLKIIQTCMWSYSDWNDFNAYLE
jgi:hypothetical protein